MSSRKSNGVEKVNDVKIIEIDSSETGTTAETRKDSCSTPKFLVSFKGSSNEPHNQQVKIQVPTPKNHGNNLAVFVRNACKRYGSKNDPVVVLNGLNMTVHKGTIYGLLGASGSGKTTLLNCILGRKKLNSGHMSVLGDAPSSSSNLGRRTGYMPQETALYGDFTIGETLTFFGWVAGMTGPNIRARMDVLAALLSLPALDQQVKSLSGGQQRRVSLAAALLHEPELLVLDEPTVGLDSVLREAIWNHFLEIAGGGSVTIIITTHYTDEARQAHVVALMRGGYLLAEEPPEDLLSRHGLCTLEDVFLKLSILQRSDNDPMEAPKKLEDVPASGGGPKKTRGATFNGNHMKALLWKDFKWLIRNPPMLMMMLLLPIIQNVIFLTGIGKDPVNLPVAVVNHGRNNLTTCNDTLVCDQSQIVCAYLRHLERRQLILVPYDSEDLAAQSVLKGQSYASIVLSHNYSAALHARIQRWDRSEPWDIEASQLEIFRDVSSKLMANYLKMLFYETFYEFLRDYMEACGIGGKFIKLPLKWEAVQGVLAPTYSDYLGPGLLVAFTAVSSMGLTACVMSMEQCEGILERYLAIGIGWVELVTIHFVIQSVIMLLQVIVTVTCFFALFDVMLKGSLALVVVLALLVGECGMCFGLCIACACNSVRMSFYATVGGLVPLVVLGGFIWPVEAMHYLLQPIASFLPLTKATKSMRSIMQTDMGFSQESVYMGFVSVGVWIGIFLTVSSLIIRFKRD